MTPVTLTKSTCYHKAARNHKAAPGWGPGKRPHPRRHRNGGVRGRSCSRTRSAWPATACARTCTTTPLGSHDGAAPAQALVPAGVVTGYTAGLVFNAGHDGPYIQSVRGRGLLTPARAAID